MTLKESVEYAFEYIANDFTTDRKKKRLIINKKNIFLVSLKKAIKYAKKYNLQTFPWRCEPVMCQRDWQGCHFVWQSLASGRGRS